MTPEWVSRLPALNASLNALASVCLVCGYIAIKKGQVSWHKRWMISALIASALFLTSYLVYHYNATMMTRYQGEGILRLIYYFILFTHIPLAVVLVPLVSLLVYWALKAQFEKHKKLARFVWPLWMYVSVTGVLIYLFLYL